MFLHNLKYSFRILLKNKSLIFWTFAFPLILGTFFQLAFSNITNSEKLNVFDIAIISNDNFNNNQLYTNAFKSLSEENDNQLFNITYTNLTEAQKLLNDDKIKGYIVFEEVPRIIVKSSGVEETILKVVTEEIIQNESIINNLIEEEIKTNGNVDYKKILEDATNLFNTKDNYIENNTNNNLDFTMIEFYTLIAMTCLYGGMFGMTSINNSLANMSTNGKRVSISPTKKLKVVLSNIVASYIMQLIGLVILFLYTIFVLKVSYGANLLLVIILTLVGSLAGLSMGTATASVFKTSENMKIGIMLSFTMLGCFLAGMMGIEMKYIIDKGLSIANTINPANMITDGFYSLYYYDTLNRFYFDLTSLIIFSFIMISISVICLRRQKYDSI